jgi:hypothetical protein
MLMVIEESSAYIDSLRSDEEQEAEAADAPTATPPADPSRAAFPMVGDDAPAAPTGGPGPGWEAAEKFFGGGPEQG